MHNSKGSMPQTFVLGDIHGAHRALRQCIERSGFNSRSDHLVALGDVADGWPQTRECIDELMTIKNLTYLLGNHDFWALEWMETGYVEPVWYDQGGKATIASYAGDVPGSHIRFLREAKPYFLQDNKLFVHAGFDRLLPIEHQSLQTLIWDRSLARIALDFHQSDVHGKLTDYDEVYLGHTPTAVGKPVHSCELWLMDSGAGWAGPLSMMNIDTKEVFLSDPVPQLYRGIRGRSRN